MKLKKPRFWDYKKPNILAFLLWPLTLASRFISIMKKNNKIKYQNIKTICVGNIYIGGTGKTSLAIKIKEILDKKNMKSCFIKKYYSDQIDEQILLEKKGKTFVKKLRTEALELAISQNYQVAIFDDGLQDNSINYDLIFVCFNNLNWIGNGFLIPAGPLRQSINSLKLYSNIFLNGNEENLTDIKSKIKKINPNIDIHEAKYSILNLENLDKNEKYLAFSGIGSHQTFINMLKNEKFDILYDIEFPDHYNYTDYDLNKILLKAKNLDSKIITTEKDYLRLNQTKTSEIKFTKTELKIIDEDKIIKALTSNNENN